MTDDLVAFLRARLDEDQANADDIHDTDTCDSVERHVLMVRNELARCLRYG